MNQYPNNYAANNGFYPRFPAVRNAYQYGGNDEEEPGLGGYGGDPRYGATPYQGYGNGNTGYDAGPAEEQAAGRENHAPDYGDDEGQHSNAGAKIQTRDHTGVFSKRSIRRWRVFASILCLFSLGSVALGIANLVLTFYVKSTTPANPIFLISPLAPSSNVCSNIFGTKNIQELLKSSGIFAFPVFLAGLLAFCLKSPFSKLAVAFLFFCFLSATILTTGIIVLSVLNCYCYAAAGGVFYFDIVIGGLAVFEFFMTLIALILVCCKRRRSHRTGQDKRHQQQQQLPKPDSIQEPESTKEPEKPTPFLPPAGPINPWQSTTLPHQYPTRPGNGPPPLPPSRPQQPAYGDYSRSAYPPPQQAYSMDRRLPAQQPYRPYQNPYGRPGYDRPMQAPYGRLY